MGREWRGGEGRGGEGEGPREGSGWGGERGKRQRTIENTFKT